MDVSDPAGPRIVHAFVPRGTPGYIVTETWDTLGMRPTRSDDTILDNVFVPKQYIARIVPAGAIDPFVGAIFAWALLNFGAIYLRALPNAPATWPSRRRARRPHWG